MIDLIINYNHFTHSQSKIIKMQNLSKQEKWVLVYNNECCLIPKCAVYSDYGSHEAIEERAIEEFGSDFNVFIYDNKYALVKSFAETFNERDKRFGLSYVSKMRKSFKRAIN